MNIFKILLVGIGGSLGSMLRYVSAKTIDARLNSSFPYGTLTVNLIGSFIIGLLFALVAKRTNSENWNVFFGAGFCGGFTTFSAFALENMTLLNQKMLATSMLYIISTLALGLLAVFIGMALGKNL